jgi:hypothetical protein
MLPAIPYIRGIFKPMIKTGFYIALMAPGGLNGVMIIGHGMTHYKCGPHNNDMRRSENNKTAYNDRSQNCDRYMQ